MNEVFHGVCLALVFLPWTLLGVAWWKFVTAPARRARRNARTVAQRIRERGYLV